MGNTSFFIHNQLLFFSFIIIILEVNIMSKYGKNNLINLEEKNEKVIDMNIIGITKKIGLEKTNLSKEFEKEDAVIIDMDKLSKDFYRNNSIIEKTITYLEEKYDIYITDLSAFFEALIKARKEVEQLDDPIYKAIEGEIDEIIKSNDNKDIIIVLEWELLPKTKYFSLSNYNVLLLPDNEIERKGTKKKKDMLEEDAQKISKKDACNINYENYKYDTIAIDLLDNAQNSLLKDFIIKELYNTKK